MSQEHQSAPLRTLLISSALQNNCEILNSVKGNLTGADIIFLFFIHFWSSYIEQTFMFPTEEELINQEVILKIISTHQHIFSHRFQGGNTFSHLSRQGSRRGDVIPYLTVANG